MRIGLALVMLALSGGCALAQAVVPTPDERFKAADKNGDGKVDKEEFMATLNPDARKYIAAIWENRDVNKDGWLTRDEMTANGAGGGGRAAALAGAGGAPGRPAPGQQGQ